MIEFGEKIKHLREEKGMTQQTMADHLYVTRQAVSRWECGARYPDLLTSKKIAEILDTTIDELVSGEEMKRNIGREPVLVAPVSNFIQTILYTVVAFSFFVMMVVVGRMSFPDTGKITALYTWGDWSRNLLCWVFAVASQGIVFGAMVFGIWFSVRNELSPHKISAIMSAVAVAPWFSVAAVLILIFPLEQGERLATNTLCFQVVGPIIFLCCIYRYFCSEMRRNPVPVYLIGVIWILEEVYHMMLMIDGGGMEMQQDRIILLLTFLLVQLLGKGALSSLMIYQAYTLDKKRKNT